MLDDEYGVPLLNEGIDAVQQLADVVKMQARSGLVKDKEDMIACFGAPFAKERSQLDPLCLAS